MVNFGEKRLRFRRIENEIFRVKSAEIENPFFMLGDKKENRSDKKLAVNFRETSPILVDKKERKKEAAT